jgi:hypothetical protein
MFSMSPMHAPGYLDAAAADVTAAFFVLLGLAFFWAGLLRRRRIAAS